MNREQTNWLDTYDDVYQVVGNSKAALFQQNLLRWFEHLDETPLVFSLVNGFEGLADFDKWLEERRETKGSFVGSGVIVWPKPKPERLGMQVALFRRFADDKLDPVDFAVDFLYSDNNFDIMVGDINNQIFHPLASELRREIVNAFAEHGDRPLNDAVPAADRTVTLAHNSAGYRATAAKIGELEEAIRGANEFPDPDEKEQRAAEVGAIARLWRAKRVRVDVMFSLVWRCLKWLAKTFADKAIGELARNLIVLIGKATGLW